MKFFEELKKRNVYKAGAAYVVTGWLLLQIVDVLGPGFGWPESITALITKILLVGFPIVLVLAWLYELTPKGFKRTGSYQEETIDNKKTGRRLNYFIIGVLVIAVCFLLVDKFFFTGNNDLEIRQQASMVDLPEFTSSIAVLAFEDMSPEKDQEYLSNGFSEEILNYLAKYKDLNVKSRTSSFAYKGKDVTISVIGDELNVAYVLEGSVRKAGDTYRITVQLIDTNDESHIWSDTFDRKIEDVLFVQDEIASIVAQRLNLTLLNEEVRLRKVDPEAYDLFLRAGFENTLFTDSTTLKADSLIRLSLEIDPNYAPAWSTLSMTTLHKGLYYNRIDKEIAVSIGLDAAKKSIELDSSFYLGYNWLSNWQWHGANGNASLKTLNKLLEINPNNEHVLEYASHAFLRMGMINTSNQIIQRGIQIYPHNLWFYSYLFSIEYGLGNYAKAISALELHNKRYERLTGKEQHMPVLAWLYYKTGNKKQAYRILKKSYPKFSRRVIEIMIKNEGGNFEEADNLIHELKTTPEEEIREIGENLDFTLALIYAAKGDINRSFEFLNKAYEFILTQTEALWSFAEFKSLHGDPRWNDLLDRLGKEFNFDFNPS